MVHTHTHDKARMEYNIVKGSANISDPDLSKMLVRNLKSQKIQIKHQGRRTSGSPHQLCRNAMQLGLEIG